jgi:hypothetical protein
MLRPAGFAVLFLAPVLPALAADRPERPDLSGYRNDCGVTIREEDGGLVVTWPAGTAEGRLVLDGRPGQPLLASLGLGGEVIGERIEPVVTMTVGTRVGTEGRPPGMSPFNEFFDSPAKRPHQTHAGRRFGGRRFVAASQGRRATVAVEGLQVGPFTGRWALTFYAGSPLVQIEAIVQSDVPSCAFLYDLGLAEDEAPPGWVMTWIDTEGRIQRSPSDPVPQDRDLAVKHRAIAAESPRGSVVIFPPPHQFFFPRDETDNLRTAWFGTNHRGLVPPFAFGIKQAETGGGAFVPWFNAPPGTEQHLGAFLLLSRDGAEAALQQALRYTRHDRFEELPGYKTFTSHWHLARAVEAMKEQAEGGLKTPEFVEMFKEMGVRIVHLAEFHGDGHPRDPGPLRRAELKAMFDECRRLSDEHLLFLPGEEANVHFGHAIPNAHPGHWLYLFPRPVAWIMTREPGQPFVEDDPRFGKLYRVGNRQEMLRLLEEERGLAWTAHPRIKASAWVPDAYKDEDFFRSDRWLGAAWKAMPADLSREKLGERALDLLDDMANWGLPKYMLGEVDVFKLDHTHELYGHMNINYLKLDRLPSYDEGWQPVLDALRAGRFFVTTGEVLIRDFTVGGKESGQTIAETKPEVKAELSWTFPLKFAEIISGDGSKVARERIDLTDTEAFRQRTLRLGPDLTGRRWVRFEVWDVAGNGAFTQPVWIEARP